MILTSLTIRYKNIVLTVIGVGSEPGIFKFVIMPDFLILRGGYEILATSDYVAFERAGSFTT